MTFTYRAIGKMQPIFSFSIDVLTPRTSGAEAQHQ